DVGDMTVNASGEERVTIPYAFRANALRRATMVPYCTYDRSSKRSPRLPIRNASRTRRGDRGRTGYFLAADAAAFCARSHQSMADRGRRWLDADRLRLRHARNARTVGASFHRDAARASDQSD